MNYTKQIGGDHYLTMKIQPWEIIDANGLNYYEGCILKYIMRRKGNRIEDLQKAIHYIEHLIELEQQKPGPRCDIPKISQAMNEDLSKVALMLCSSISPERKLPCILPIGHYGYHRSGHRANDYIWKGDENK